MSEALEDLARREAVWPYGDSCAFCAAGNHASCLKTRWLISNDTAAARKQGTAEDRMLQQTGGICGCYERNHEGAKGVRGERAQS